MISFILVNYNSLNLTKRAIDSILYSLEDLNSSEIILVDNASTDGSKEFFEKLEKEIENFKYIYNETNGGFGKANNIGAMYAKGDILVLINPDIEIHQKGFDVFIKEHLTDEIGILAPKIIYADGTLQPNGGGFATFWTYIFYSLRLGYLARKYHLAASLAQISQKMPFIKRTVVGKYLDNFSENDKNERECDWISGACMVIRKELFMEIGGFDENFFMYVEDEELCRRVRLKGYKIIINKGFTIVHLEGGTQQKESPILSKAFRERYKSSIYYFYKYEGLFYAIMLKYYFVLVHLIIALIYLLKGKLNISKDRLIFIRELTQYKVVK